MGSLRLDSIRDWDLTGFGGCNHYVVLAMFAANSGISSSCRMPFCSVMGIEAGAIDIVDKRHERSKPSCCIRKVVLS